MKKANIIAYNKLGKSKKVTEVFLGTLKVNWDFLKVNYKANCTEALPLNFLEKMVCGIVELEHNCGLNQLGAIMGLNVVDDPSHLKFRDQAEVEILLETLKTLKNFEMITADEDFNNVELTTIGHEYYEQGRKFIKGQEKGFTMFYDFMSSNHNNAKHLFEKIVADGNSSTNEDCIPFDKEDFVKQFAESQIPDYYNKEIGNSFKDMSVVSSEFLYKSITVAVLNDTLDGTYRLEVVDNGGIDTTYLNQIIKSESKFAEIVHEFTESKLTDESKSSSQLEYENEVSQIQSDADYAIYEKRLQDAVDIVTNYFRAPSYIESEAIISLVESHKDSMDGGYLYLHIPEISDVESTYIKDLARTSNLVIMLTAGNVSNFDCSYGNNVLVMQDEKTPSPVLLSKQISYMCGKMVFSCKDGNIAINVLKKSTSESGASELENIRRKFAEIFVLHEIEDAEDKLAEDEYEDAEKRIKELRDIICSVHFSVDEINMVGLLERYNELLQAIENKKRSIIDEYSRKLLNEVTNLIQATSIDDIDTLEAMDEKKSALEAIKNRFLSEQEDSENDTAVALCNVANDFSSRLEEREMFLRQNLLPKNYILDTNVFVYCPYIMKYIGQDDHIVLAAKVLNELDKLKTSLKGVQKNNVKIAIREINHKHKMKSESVIYGHAKTDLLPEDYDKKNSDNMILSVALQFNNPFIVTDDLNFQNRAAALGIPFKSLKDIVGEDEYKKMSLMMAKVNKPVSELSSRSKDIKYSSLLDLLIKAYNVCRETQSDVKVAQLASTIKQIDAEFNVKTYGHTKFKEFCIANSDLIELYNDEHNALCARLKVAKSDRSVNDNSSELDSTLYIQLEELVKSMISEEEATNPVKDGDIRKEFMRQTKQNIKLKVVVSIRESLGIPSRKIRIEQNKINK